MTLVQEYRAATGHGAVAKKHRQRLSIIEWPEKARSNFQQALELLDHLKAQNALGDFDKQLYSDVQLSLQRTGQPSVKAQ